MSDKFALLTNGLNVMGSFCKANGMAAPRIRAVDLHAWRLGACAYYRAGTTSICVARCAHIGTSPRQWSYPGYTVDRTPYGVVQHELGHHVDLMRGQRKGPYWSEFSSAVRGQSGEARITTYCPNDAEWFAEMFRVFVTNPDLLKLLRPRTHRELSCSFTPVFTDTWRDRLKGAPARWITAAERKIEDAT